MTGTATIRFVALAATALLASAIQADAQPCIAGEACTIDQPGACFDEGTVSCESDAAGDEALCLVDDVDGFGTVEQASVPDGLLNRTDRQVGGSDYKLITSNGRYLFNLAFGAGNDRNGYTVRVFDPQDGFRLVKHFHAPNASLYIDGISAKGDILYAVQWTGADGAEVVAIDWQLGRVVGKTTIPQGATQAIEGQYDWVNDVFWLGALRFGETVYEWPGTGMEGLPSESFDYREFDPNGGAGTVATDGRFLYVKRWVSYPGSAELERIGTGYGNTVAGWNYGTVGVGTVATLSTTYHPDGYVYIGGTQGYALQRVKVGEDRSETCDSVDNDCNGVPDDDLSRTCSSECDLGEQQCVDGAWDECDAPQPGVCGCGVPDKDTDGDGTPNCVDGCPADGGKTAPGTCGCGVADTDSDGDGTPDCNDLCRADPAKTSPGTCGCGVADTDSDGDGTLDCNDTCPADAGKTAPGTCGCGVADTDSDGDGTLDCNDTCPADAGKTAPGTCGCGVADTDSDGDGTLDCNDTCPADAGKTAPGTCGCGVADTDSDGDGTLDCNDTCPADAGKTAPGTCGCGVADTDSDGDGTPDCNDNTICLYADEDLTLSGAAVLTLVVEGTVPCAEHSQVVIEGENRTVSFQDEADVALDIHPDYEAVAAVGDELVLFDLVEPNSSLVGTFGDTPEGGTRVVGLLAFRVSYVGGDGNDAVFTLCARGESGGAPPSCEGPGPRVRIDEEIVALAALRDQGSDKDGRRIDKALEQLEKAAAKGWDDRGTSDRDDDLLDRDGKKVFQRLRKAVDDLGKVEGVDVGGSIERLVEVAEDLALLAIEAAEQALAAADCGAVKCDKASRELDRAADDLAEARHTWAGGDGEKAIKQLGDAWRHARKALDRLAPDDSDDEDSDD